MDILRFVGQPKHIAFLVAAMSIIAIILGIQVATGGIEGSTFGTAMYSSVGPLFVIINSIMVFKHNQDLANA
jgi:glucose dehydrogenase